MKHIKKIRDFLKKTPVVHVQSIKNMVRNDTYVHLLLHNLRQKKEIHRVTKGWYSISDDPTLAVFCFNPSYLGLQEALSIHNLWEQESNPVILTTKTVREGIRQLNGSNIILKRIPSSLFFGIEYKECGATYVPVSDVEKTFLDMLYFRQPIEKETLRLFRKRMDKKKLKKYGKLFPKDIREKAVRVVGV